MIQHTAPKHTPHLNAPFARQLGRLVRATIDEHQQGAVGTIAAALAIYDIVEHHAKSVARGMGIESGEFCVRLFQAIATDDDLDRIATRAEQDAEAAMYERLRSRVHPTAAEQGPKAEGP